MLFRLSLLMFSLFCLCNVPNVLAETVGPYPVSRVIDGDTIELIMDGSKAKVRLIGVDTPETVHPSKPVEYFGKEASAFTKHMLEGQQVYLEFDQDRVDRYNRVLAYVYRIDGYFVNLELIKEGYGHAYTRFPFSKMDEFRAAEKGAREAGRGLWGDGKQVVKKISPQVGSGTLEVFVTKSGKKYHADGCRYLSKSRIPISLEKATKRYAPCGTCSPPESEANKKVDPTPEGSQCQATTKKGTQCSRKAKDGSKYCWQHGG
jgi:micrococcal nuclease